MTLKTLRAKLEFSTLAIALLPLGIILLIVIQVFETTFREDRIKLFVEQATSSIARLLDDSLERFTADFRQIAADVAHGSETSRDLTPLLNQDARRQVSPYLSDGIYDLLVVVDSSGHVVSANSHDRFGNPLRMEKLLQRPISDFSQEAAMVSEALSTGIVKQDWYQSAAVREVCDLSQGDEARRHNIALATRLPASGLTVIGVINWEAIQTLLDTVEVKMRAVGFDSGYAFLLKKDRDTTIGHKFRDPKGINNYGTSLRATHGLIDLYRAAFENRSSFRYNYRGSKISGLSRIADQDFNWTVGVGLSDADAIRPVWTVAKYLAAVAVLLSAIIILLTRWLARGITTPVDRLTQSVKVIAGGQFDERVPVTSEDEIGQLAREFNRMAESISERDRRLYEQQQKLIEEEKLRREVEITKSVVERLYPLHPPRLANLQVAGACVPALQVGGDYYDFVRVADTQLGIAIADISGKGLPAALLVSNLQASLRSQARHAGTRLSDLLESMNRLFYETTEEHRYATFFYGVYDEVESTLTYVNAGHNPPVVIRHHPSQAPQSTLGVNPVPYVTQSEAPSANAAAASLDRHQLLPANAPVLGLFEEWVCEPEVLHVGPGDVLVAYTDGVLEALNEKDELSSLDRLIRAIRERAHLDAQTLTQSLLDEVLRTVPEAEQGDDIAIVVAKRN